MNLKKTLVSLQSQSVEGDNLESFYQLKNSVVIKSGQWPNVKSMLLNVII